MQRILTNVIGDPEVLIVERGVWLPIDTVSGEESHGKQIWLYTPSAEGKTARHLAALVGLSHAGVDKIVKKETGK